MTIPSSPAAAFSAVSTRVSETENLVYEVNNAIKEQQLGAEQILDALKRMNEITFEVKKGSGAMREGNNMMLTEIGSLQSQSKDISLAMENITTDMNTIGTSESAVLKLAKDTHMAIEQIRNIVNDFEV